MSVERDGEEFGVVEVDLESLMKVQFLNMERIVGSSQLSIMVVVARGWVTSKLLKGMFCSQIV